MAWKFRKRVKVFPGLTINLSRSGASYTIGGKGASINVGKKGTFLNTSIPGTGIYDRKKISNGNYTKTEESNYYNKSNDVSINNESLTNYDKNEIKTSDGLNSLKDSIDGILYKRREIENHIHNISADYKMLYNKYNLFNIFIVKIIFRSKLSNINNKLHQCTEQLKELNDQLLLCKINVYIEFDLQTKQLFEKLLESFTKLSDCEKAWDVISSYNVDHSQRIPITDSFGRMSIVLELKNDPIVVCNHPTCFFKNGLGVDLYFYPKYLLIENNNEIIIIDFIDLSVKYEPSRFCETNGMVLEYGILILESKNGLFEKFMFSNAPICFNFVSNFNEYKNYITKS